MYVGQVNNKKEPHGIGRKLEGSSIEEGQFKNGLPMGFSRVITEDGDFYVGFYLAVESEHAGASRGSSRKGSRKNTPRGSPKKEKEGDGEVVGEGDATTSGMDLGGLNDFAYPNGYGIGINEFGVVE